jgi:hypothetical protein
MGAIKRSNLTSQPGMLLPSGLLPRLHVTHPPSALHGDMAEANTLVGVSHEKEVR